MILKRCIEERFITGTTSRGWEKSDKDSLKELLEEKMDLGNPGMSTVKVIKIGDECIVSYTYRDKPFWIYSYKEA